MPNTRHLHVADHLGIKLGVSSVLVASDVAGRGLDIPECELVIHYRPPVNAQVYIHRSGRTGRAGRQGTSIVLYASPVDDDFVFQIQERNQIQMTVCCIYHTAIAYVLSD
jgi:superfamily II DNA/RNA helicase